MGGGWNGIKLIMTKFGKPHNIFKITVGDGRKVIYILSRMGERKVI